MLTGGLGENQHLSTMCLQGYKDSNSKRGAHIFASSDGWTWYPNDQGHGLMTEVPSGAEDPLCKCDCCILNLMWLKCSPVGADIV
ncbi:hypothetical protein TNCV_4700921 [Trichonephila clavipes]|nr:hypothetical protein TNCV_4700921 [Trichonephila clavipes]